MASSRLLHFKFSSPIAASKVKPKGNLSPNKKRHTRGKQPLSVTLWAVLLSLALPPSLSPSLPICVSLYQSVCLSVCLYRSVSLFLYLSLCLSLFISPSVSVSLSLSLPLSLSLSPSLCLPSVLVSVDPSARALIESLFRGFIEIFCSYKSWISSTAVSCLFLYADGRWAFVAAQSCWHAVSPWTWRLLPCAWLRPFISVALSRRDGSGGIYR